MNPEQIVLNDVELELKGIARDGRKVTLTGSFAEGNFSHLPPESVNTYFSWEEVIATPTLFNLRLKYKKGAGPIYTVKVHAREVHRTARIDVSGNNTDTIAQARKAAGVESETPYRWVSKDELEFYWTEKVYD